jgi:hypothetical protein
LITAARISKIWGHPKFSVVPQLSPPALSDWLCCIFLSSNASGSHFRTDWVGTFFFIQLLSESLAHSLYSSFFLSFLSFSIYRESRGILCLKCLLLIRYKWRCIVV